MKVTKEELRALITESVQEELGEMTEEELHELFGGLKGVFGGAARGIQAGAQAAGSAVSRGVNAVGSAVSGAAQKAGNAVAGAAQNAGNAIKGAYQSGERTSALNTAKTQIQRALKNKADASVLQPVLAAIDKALQTPEAPGAPSQGPGSPPAPASTQPAMNAPGASMMNEKKLVRTKKTS